MRVSFFALALCAASFGCAVAGERTPPPPPAAPASPATFDELLAAVAAADASERQGLADAFLEGRALPLVEEGAAVFVLRLPSPSQATLRVAGDFDGWIGEPLAHLEDTDVAWGRVPLPEDARVDYKFIVDGEYLLDAANPATCPSGFGDNSELAMPAWTYPADIDFDAAIPHGTLNGVEIAGDDVPAPLALESRGLGNVRDVWIYVPARNDDPLPLLVVNDGGDYLRLAHMQHVLDATIARGDIEPIAVAFVSPVDREAEYVGASVPDYVTLVRDELIPLVEEHVTLAADPGVHGVWGTSFSGYVAVRLAADALDDDGAPLFGRVASQSGRLLIDGGRAIEALVPRAGRLWVDTGLLFDTAEENRDALGRLSDSALDVAFLEVNEGHSWGSWRARIAPGLRPLFGPTD